MFKFAPLLLLEWDRRQYTSRLQTFPHVFCGPGPSRSSKKQFVSSTTYVREPLSRCWNTRSGPAIWRRTANASTRPTERQLFQQWTVSQLLTIDNTVGWITNWRYRRYFDRNSRNSHRKCVILSYELDTHKLLSTYLVLVPPTRIKSSIVFVSQFKVDLMNILASLMMNDFGDLHVSFVKSQGHKIENKKSGIETGCQFGVFIRKFGLKRESNQPNHTHLPRPTRNSHCRQPILLRLFTASHTILY